ncbi:MAG TPA: ATP-binding protein, partial [Nitrococcus sp.]|nr:ATP-binding protein [Nitrococcus sp.]
FLTFLAFPAAVMPVKYRRRIRAATLTTLLIMLLTLTPLAFKDLRVTGGHASPEPAPGIGLVLVQTVTLLGLSIGNIVSRFRHAQGRLKAQLRLIILGIAGTFSLIIVTNFILVVLFDNTMLVPFGPAFTLIFSFAFAYAIIRHRLFDIRRAAARGLGYVLTVITLAAIYSFVVFGFSSFIIGTNGSPRQTQMVYTVLALLLAFSFQPLKQFFDQISRRVFFKDAYDPQKLLDELNKVLVAEVELKRLLRGSLDIIQENLKSDSYAFAIRETSYSPVRVTISRGSKFTEEDVKDLRPQLIHSHHKIIVADYLEGHESEWGRELNDKDMAVIVRLVPTVSSRADEVGEIVLGPKRSGDPYTREDVQLLEIIANELVIAIENALRFEEIENFNATLQQKIVEATHQLRRSNEKLKSLDETKDDFISMASHQLRTPLTSVKGYLSMVLEGDTGKITPMQQKMLSQAFFSSQRMVYLIADLLNVSRLKTGKFVIDPAPCNLATVVEEEMSQLMETAASKDLTLTYDKPKDFPTLMLDETKTRQVIMNFVDNAIYYTPAGGKIEVQLVETPTTVEFRVTDNGIGVPKAEQHHLFTKFYRAGNARKARPDGTGLGLFMAKKVVMGQGGAIIFESVENKGSTFGFVFSKSKLAVKHPAVAPVANREPVPTNP